MSIAEGLVGVLVLVAVLSFTALVIVVLREGDGPTARHYANLTLPCGLLPLFLALALAGPRAALGAASLIVLFQLISGAAESHTTGRLALLRRRRAREENGEESA